MSQQTSSNNWQSLVQSKLTRRSFVRGLGVFGAGAAAHSVLPSFVLGDKKAEASVVNNGSKTVAARPARVPFTPIEPTTADDIVLPEGYRYQVIAARGDVFTPDGRILGDNFDWTGWYPIDALEGGNSTTEGYLVVNHEYFNPLFIGTDVEERGPEQFATEKAMIGVSTIHIRKEGDAWVVVTDSATARRYDATDAIGFSGPVAGTDVVNGATEVIGTLANCSGGQTPWLTALSCEENFQDWYGADKNNIGGTWPADEGQLPEHYGWVVEIDPYTGVATKRTALGRFRHENTATGIGASGKVVIYMGDDSQDECVYKFMSDGTYDASNRDANLNILDSGTLYVANFQNGVWLPVVYEGNEERLGDADAIGYTIASQADVLTYANVVARALGGTQTDRPEDIEIHPLTNDVYVALTNNARHGNFHGQIVRISETNGDLESLEFAWDIFAVGGPQSGFSSPDNLAFDPAGNLWMVTDISTSRVATGIYEFQGNNAMFFMPTEGEDYGKAYLFASGPVQCELTGPTFLDPTTLILAVQHPGEVSESLDALTSNWPEGNGAVPKSAVVAIYGPFNS